jgi:hypothetical protein
VRAATVPVPVPSILAALPEAREARQASISHRHTEQRKVGRTPDTFRPIAEVSVTEL